MRILWYAIEFRWSNLSKESLGFYRVSRDDINGGQVDKCILGKGVLS